MLPSTRSLFARYIYSILPSTYLHHSHTYLPPPIPSPPEPLTNTPQVWIGSASGFLLCLIIGGGIIGAFYGLSRDAWANTEYYWEGSFGLVAAIIITALGAALLRVAKMQEKWRVKPAKAPEGKPVTEKGKRNAFARWCEKYAMFLVPFITVLREGIEAIVFIAGVSFSSPAASVPLPVVMGLIAGALVGYIIYK